MRVSAGVVYLVGAGPGDPGLLTVRGRELLASCDTIVYDALVNPMLVDDAWIGRRSEAEKIFVGKRGGTPSMEQDAITALLLELARDGKRVVRLKGGDPMVFGRGGEEAIALAAAGLEFEVVPGITAGVAAPAYAGIPVTHRGLSTSVTFITGHEDPGKDKDQTDWAALARAGGTLVLYMGVSRLAKIANALIEGGRSPETPAAIIEWGTYPRQRTVTATLATLAERAAREKVIAPSIAIVGDVVSLREEMSWFDRRPLFGRTIVVTRAREQASQLRTALEIAGATVIEAPAIRIEPLDQEPLRRALGAARDVQVGRRHEPQRRRPVVDGAARARSRRARARECEALRGGARDGRRAARARTRGRRRPRSLRGGGRDREAPRARQCAWRARALRARRGCAGAAPRRASRDGRRRG